MTCCSCRPAGTDIAISISRAGPVSSRKDALNVVHRPSANERNRLHSIASIMRSRASTHSRRPVCLQLLTDRRLAVRKPQPPDPCPSAWSPDQAAARSDARKRSLPRGTIPGSCRASSRRCEIIEPRKYHQIRGGKCRVYSPSAFEPPASCTDLARSQALSGSSIAEVDQQFAQISAIPASGEGSGFPRAIAALVASHRDKTPRPGRSASAETSKDRRGRCELAP